MPPDQRLIAAMRRKILIVELWGLGDLTFSTPVIAAALASGDEVHLLGKPHAKELLGPSFPDLKFIPCNAPWTAYRGKYKLWRWDGLGLSRLLVRLRAEKYDVAVSVRNDPRDRLLMLLIGARERIGFAQKSLRTYFGLGRMFLTKRMERLKAKQHKVEDWRQIGGEIGLSAAVIADPVLDRTRYTTERVDCIFASVNKPVLCLHTGARIAVRRWPEKYFLQIIASLRESYDFHLIVIPEPQTLPSALTGIADVSLTDLSIHELTDVLGRSDLLLCNDSGPGHIAAACGRPVISIFGPSDPDWFRPWGGLHKVVLRDICPWRPCFDYCKFSEPYCMTHLLPQTVWPEVDGHIRKLIASGALPDRLVKNTAQLADTRA